MVAPLNGPAKAPACCDPAGQGHGPVRWAGGAFVRPAPEDSRNHGLCRRPAGQARQEPGPQGGLSINPAPGALPGDRAPKDDPVPGQGPLCPAARPGRYRPASLRSRRLRMISYPTAPRSVAVIMISASALIVGVIPVRTLEKT